MNFFTILDKNLVLNFLGDPEGFTMRMQQEASQIFIQELEAFRSKVEEGPTSGMYVLTSAIKASQTRLEAMLAAEKLDLVDLKLDCVGDGVIRLTLSLKEGTYVPPSTTMQVQ